MNIILILAVLMCILTLYLFFFRDLFFFRKTGTLNISIYVPKTFIKIKGDNLMAEMTNTTYVMSVIAPQNRLGGPAEVENVTWTTNSPDLVELSFPEENNPKVCKIRALGGVGPATVFVSADVNLDPDITEFIEDFVTLDIRPAEAVSLGINLGEPIEQ